MTIARAPLWAAVLLAACRGTAPSSFPRVEVLPQPDLAFSFQVDGREILRYHAGASHPKPHFYPVVGPAGRPVTRITHPRDPHGHGHHLSLWIGHQNAGGHNFWEHFRSPARIVHDRVLKIEDGASAALAIAARWLDGEKKAVLRDERVWRLTPLGTSGEFYLDLTLTLVPETPALELGRSNFGMLAVRVAKTMGVQDGKGRITNSEGKHDEGGLMPHRRARWCDYSGVAAPPEVWNGITLFDHPENPGHPAYFHVRNDGWMGAALTQAGGITLSKEKPLVLRYRFWVHDGPCDPRKADAAWAEWATSSAPR